MAAPLFFSQAFRAPTCPADCFALYIFRGLCWTNYGFSLFLARGYCFWVFYFSDPLPNWPSAAFLRPFFSCCMTLFVIPPPANLPFLFGFAASSAPPIGAPHRHILMMFTGSGVSKETFLSPSWFFLRRSAHNLLIRHCLRCIEVQFSFLRPCVIFLISGSCRFEVFCFSVPPFLTPCRTAVVTFFLVLCLLPSLTHQNARHLCRPSFV